LLGKLFVVEMTIVFKTNQPPGASMSTQKKTTRRVFMIQNAVASAAVLMAVDASAQAMVSESDPQAAALGYVADTNKVNKSKFPKHAANQACSNCVLYQGAAGAAAGGCGIFPGKQVSAKGWCSAYNKKA
jgi:exopolysaccharide biosynthesis protein